MKNHADNATRYLELMKRALTFMPEKLAVMRLDGDLYQSTWEALTSLYPKLSVGGYCIIDDYALAICPEAVDDFRHQYGISDPIEQIDWTGVFWKKSRS